MLILALKPSHDGAIAVVEDRKLLLSLESEKDSFPRHSRVTPTHGPQALEHIDAMPDVIALGGWLKPAGAPLGAGYGARTSRSQRPVRMLGKEATFFTSSHERSHIMMAVGMAPRDEPPLRAVLVWEGAVGGFYLLDERWEVVPRDPGAVGSPGARYAFLFALADPTFPDRRPLAAARGRGKLMALAAFGDPARCRPEIVETVDGSSPSRRLVRLPKREFRDSPLYNAGVECRGTQDRGGAAHRAHLRRSSRTPPREHLPPGIPLYISGGCGLNCDWNCTWRELGHFSSVFVPPCTNDSGSALGTAHRRARGR